jgi:trk system potassium uptake protein TrkA
MRRFAVIGLGQFGYQVAVSLAELGADVLAIDKNSDVCEAIKVVDGVHPMSLDATDERALRSAGLEDVEAVVVAIGQHLEVSIVVTALLHRMAVPIVARSSSDLHEQILKEVGARTVLNPEREMGIKAAQTIFSPDLHDRMKLPSGHHLVEVDARRPLWGKTIGELDFRNRFELNVLAIKKRRPYVDQFGESAYTIETNLLPSGSDGIDEGDILVVAGSDTHVREFLEI